MSFIIRKIQEKDNTVVASIIRTVLAEFEAPKTGTALADPELDFMSEAYANGRKAYFVAELETEIVGCCGIGPLSGAEASTAELQKMYVTASARNQGVAAALIDTCLKTARDFNYKQVYLETFPTMGAAQKLYLRHGFRYIDTPMGNTGHTSCPVWMLLDF